MRAREIAGVVDLQPQLAEAVRLDVLRAAGIRLAFDGNIEEHRRAVERGEEIMDMQPRFATLEMVARCVSRHERAKRHWLGSDLSQNLGAALLDRDPVRRLGIHGTGNSGFLEKV